MVEQPATARTPATGLASQTAAMSKAQPWIRIHVPDESHEAAAAPTDAARKPAAGRRCAAALLSTPSLITQHLLFVIVLICFQMDTFAVWDKLEVHNNLNARLGLRDEALLGISGDTSMYRWISDTLIPALSGANSRTVLQPVQVSGEECLRDTTWGSPLSAEHCAVCDNIKTAQAATIEHRAESRDDPHLGFVDSNTLLYSGVSIRQAPHCSITRVNRQSGTLETYSVEELGLADASAAFYLPCEPSTRYESSFATTRSSIPPQFCYGTTNLSTFAETQEPSLRPWINRASVQKRRFYLPCSSSANQTAAATAAAQATLSLIEASHWLDVSTAMVEILFMTMSPQYGMLTEVRVRFHFRLGGDSSVITSLRSIPGRTLTKITYSLVDVSLLVMMLWCEYYI